MAFGDEKVVVDVRDVEHSDEIEYADKAGAKHTYYPCQANWLKVEDLQVLIALTNPPEGTKEPGLVTRIRGIARLEDRSLSVVGDPATKTCTLTVSFEAGEWPPKDTEELILYRATHLFSPMGVAMLGFNRADWEIGNKSEWWVSCYVPAAFVQALEASVKSGQLTSVRVGLALRGLYTTVHSYARISAGGDLFIRPNRSDNTIEIPDMASGYVHSLYLTTAKVDLRKPEPIEPEDTSFDDAPTPPAIPVNPVANAVDLLSARVEKLRTTLKWVGGFIAVAVFLLVMK